MFQQNIICWKTIYILPQLSLMKVKSYKCYEFYFINFNVWELKDKDDNNKKDKEDEDNDNKEDLIAYSL